jgi:hypothetical protein
MTNRAQPATVERQRDPRIRPPYAGITRRMRTAALVLIATASVAATIGLPATAHADDAGAFQSPSGNVNCLIGTFVGGDDDNFVYCDVANRIWVAPPRPADCPLVWGSRFRLDEGKAAGFGCYHQELPAPESTLDYGQRRSVGPITCDSEPAGMTCTDGSTGHFFRISRESYQFG